MPRWLFAEVESPVEANVTRVSDKSIVIPGDGPVGNKSQLIEFRDMLVGVRENIAALKRQGRSPREIIEARPTADYHAKCGGFLIDGKTFTEPVFAGV